MKILVINAGSSSLKYQLINMNDESVLAKGNVERIGLAEPLLKHTPQGRSPIEIHGDYKDHVAAIKKVIETLIHEDYGVIGSMDEIKAVGHRVVHGGERFSSSVLIDDEVMKAIEANIELAPLHNPANIMGINACRNVMPNTPMVAVFDTAFHQTMPQKAFMYAIPYSAYEKFGVRRYGFHGTSHKYVSLKAAQILKKPIESLKIITCHLGNGSSIAAIDGGKSIDTSMGFTPLEGLPMGTRSGSIDPAILSYLMDKLDMNCEEINVLLNRESGMLGLSGVSSDFRDLHKAAAEGNMRAQLALDVFNYEVKKYIGAYAVAMGGVDCIVFTAGVGENTPEVRTRACSGLEFMGIKIDEEKNHRKLGSPDWDGDISTDDSTVRVLVVPTNEELMIARETMDII
ncbi:MAG: acetate/propionate family kinase [Caldicoprobacterales bacterium]|jgi:acetate kinase|nr:acetate kinase [Clostridiales bacterium]